MSAMLRQTLWIIASLLVAAGAWWWFDTFEKGWQAAPNSSTASRDNPMLAATRLLKLHKHAVTAEATLGEAMLKPLPSGTIVLPETNGVISADQAKQLLAWVAQGNTLITRPKWGSISSRDDDKKNPKGDDKVIDQDVDSAKTDESDDDNDESEATDEPDLVDPIGARVGLILEPVTSGRNKGSVPPPDTPPPTSSPTPITAAGKKPPSRITMIRIPGLSYPLQVQADFASLREKNRAATPLFADDDGVAVRVYQEGKGHLVMIANNEFDNRRLGSYDHAELLLNLVQLRPNADGSKNHVLLIQRLAILPWYQALWNAFHAAMISAGVGLLLLFWVALRRFGPLMPEPDQERRSLMEHIDASGRWLWKVPGGRDILLSATRAATLRIIERRAPEMVQVGSSEQSQLLATACSLSRANIASALHQRASSRPIDFTRQIQTLQQLRKHYER